MMSSESVSHLSGLGRDLKAGTTMHFTKNGNYHELSHVHPQSRTGPQLYASMGSSYIDYLMD